MMRTLLSHALAGAALCLLGGQAHAGLLGYWTFDDDSLADRSGHGYHAAQPGAAGSPAGATNPVVFSNDLPPLPQRADTTNSRSLDCTGTRAAFVSTGGNEGVFNFAGSRFSIAFWFKTWPAGSFVPFVAKGGENYGGVNQGWQVRRSGTTNNLDFTTRGIGLNNGDFPSQDAQPGAKANGVWQHAAVVYDGSWKHIYINGVHARSEAAPNQSLVATTAKLTFGARHNPATNSWEGHSNCRLDDIAIFDHALVAAEVGDLYAGADPRNGLRTTTRPFDFGWAADEPRLPQGGPGYIGLREIRTNGQVLPLTSDAIVYAPTDAVLYARRLPTIPAGSAVIANRDGSSNPLLTVLDFQDPQLGSLGSNNFALDFLTNSPAADDSFFQVAQGCFKVNVPGKYSFYFRGDDGMAFSIMGRTWEKIVLNNGAGSISGDALQNGQPTGDTNTLGVIDLPAGSYNWRYVWNEQGGGAWNEALYAPGEKAGYDATFRQFGDSAGGLELVDHVPLVDFRGSTQFVSNGNPGTITLTWGAAYASSVKLNGGTFTNEDVTASTINGVGSMTVPSPSSTTTYTLTAARGVATESQTVTVLVNAPPSLPSFTADDTTLGAGAPITFRWNASGYDTVSLSDGVSTWDVTANTDITGAGFINTLTAPAETRTYTLTATNAFGATPRQVTIQVGVPPSITSFTANDVFVEPDTLVRFNYTVSGADSVTFSPNFSGTPTPVPSGQISERVLARTTYQLTAINGFGQSTQSLLVDVVQPLGITASGWTVTLFKSASTQINNLTQADQLIAGTIGRGPVIVGTTSTPTPITITGQPRINFADIVPTGAFGNDVWPTASFGSAAIDDFVLRATATLVVSSSGEFTLNINNDDGGRLRIDLNNDGDFTDAGETLINDDALHGPITTSVEKVLNSGNYPIEYLYFERGGGAGGEVFYTNENSQITLLEFGSTPPAITFPDLQITEFLANNQGGIRDGQGDREDWIEIYNGTGAPRSLAGYYLTDDPAILNKWAFPTSPARVLSSGEYFLVFASGKAITLPGQEYHTNFRLNNDGEYLALTKSDGAGGFTIVQEFAPTFPPQTANVSYGQFDSEHYTGFFLNPTPRGRNGGGYDGFVIGETHARVTQNGLPAAYNRGIYDGPIVVTLTKDDPSATLRYTLDGSTPSPSVGLDYTGPLTINKTTVVRSAAVRSGYISSEVDTHTYIFLDDVITQTPATAISKGWPSAPVNGQVFDYGMSPSVIAGNEEATKAALRNIPTISIVTDLTNLVHPQRGIYVNPSGRGKAFERPASIELINNDGSGGGQFQHDCGLRIRGGFSRAVSNPKHAWHLYFRNEYDGDLRFPMFGSEGARQFEQLDLQTPQNYSWSFSPQVNTYSYTAPGNVPTTVRLRYNTFVREPVSRDLFGAMGQPYGRSRHYHCYVNGQYWGLYTSQERPEASFGATYLGGSKDNYDTIKSAGNAAGYNTEATDGSFTQGTSAAPGSPWAKLWWRTNDLRYISGMTEAQRRTIYFELQGLDPNGVPYNDPVLHPVVLDPDNLIDYMLVTWFSGSFDAPLSTFLNSASNNWFAIRDRLGMRGFVYFPHDFEHGMGTDLQTTGTWGNGQQNNIRSTDRTGPWGGNGANNTNVNVRGHGMYNQLQTYLKSNPEYFHENLASCLEYRVRFQDRAFRHLTRPGGALTLPKVQAAIDARAGVIRTAILAESARWGDAKGLGPLDFMPAAWEESITQLKGWVARGSNAEYLAGIPTQANPSGSPGLGRSGRLIAQLKAYSDELFVPAVGSNVSLALYSVLEGPTLSSLGGVVSSGSTVTITNPNGGGTTGTIYYSLDGTDPRAIGGAINTSPSVQSAANPATVPLTKTGRLMARIYNSATSTWSGLNFADFIVGTPATNAQLVITEINYNPAPGAPGTPTAGDVQSFEFIEIQNVSPSVTVDLSNVRFTNGITYTFPTGRLLAPGERIVVVRDIAAFQSRYPNSLYPGLSDKVVGPWTGGLDNGGETLTLVDNFGATIVSFTYGDSTPWPNGPDGGGSTLVFTGKDPLLANAGDSRHWSSHGQLHGNPGGSDITTYAASALANGLSPDGRGDTDGDGIADALEYLLGETVARDSSAKLPKAAVTLLTVNGTPDKYLTLTYTRAAGTADLNVVCETATDLNTANWTANAVLVSRETGVDGAETFTFRSPTPIGTLPARFMRLRVDL